MVYGTYAEHFEQGEDDMYDEEQILVEKSN